MEDQSTDKHLVAVGRPWMAEYHRYDFNRRFFLPSRAAVLHSSVSTWLFFLLFTLRRHPCLWGPAPLSIGFVLHTPGLAKQLTIIDWWGGARRHQVIELDGRRSSNNTSYLYMLTSITHVRFPKQNQLCDFGSVCFLNVFAWLWRHGFNYTIEILHFHI